MYRKYLKRWFDFIFALIALIILSPLFLCIFIVIKSNSAGPAVFKQARIGRNGQVFQMYKFRTMALNAPTNCPTHLFEKPEAFITKPGKFMRGTSLDELPQLINILKGDMSIVGPRPSLVNQTDLILLRNNNGSSAVRPGLTGLAQINGRDELPIDQKANYDGIYAEHITFIEDLKIIFNTIFIVLTHSGIKEGKQ